MLTLKIPPPIYALSAALLMWAMARFLPDFSLVISLPPLFNRLLIILLIALAIVFDGTALILFLQQKTTINPCFPERAKVLITTGIYRFSRNPMYMGMVFLLIAWAIHLMHPLPWMVIPLFIMVVQHLQILPEEKILRQRFNANYQNYCRQVRRWI